jgi:hypothetical protein
MAVMVKPTALSRTQAPAQSVVDIARALIVGACGLALVLAGPVLPF